MSYPIITTDVSQMRPVFAQGAGENIKRYTQLKKMFESGMEYAVLAEPNMEGQKRIKWCTEYEGVSTPYSSLSESEQIAAKGIIKHQVNKLYKAVFRQLYRGSMSDVADMFKVLDSCIEIPDYSDLYRIMQPDGSSHFVIIRWGFVGDSFNSPSGLIKKLIPIKVDTIRIKVLQDSEPKAGQPVSVVLDDGRTLNLVTNQEGCVFVEDVLLGSAFSVYVDSPSKSADYVCDASPEYHYEMEPKPKPIPVVVPPVAAPSPQPAYIPEASTAPSAMETSFANAPQAQPEKEKRRKWGFLFWLLPLLLIGALAGFLLVDTPVAVAERQLMITVEDSTDTSVRIPGAVVELMSPNGSVLRDTADEYGVCRFMVDTSRDTLVARISAADFVSKVQDIYVHQGDTVVMLAHEIKGITMLVKDEKSGAPVAGAKVIMKYQGTEAQVTTDSNGVAKYEQMPVDPSLQIKVLVEAAGYNQYVNSFYYQPEKIILLPEKSLDIRDIPVDCGAVIRSDGCHSTIQTVSLKLPKGKFQVHYKMNTVPDELIVYTGCASEISPDKIIFSTPGKVSGKGSVVINYDTPDGIITVRVNGGNETTTQWEIKVLCPDEN